MATNGGYVHGLPTESSSQALPFNMQNDKEKSDTVIKEVPLGTPNSEKPKALSVPAMPSYRRSMELSRPKQKQKPLPLDRFHRAWKDQAALVRGMAITLLTGIPFIIFFLVARYALPAHLTIGPKELGATIFELSKWLFCAWGSFWILLWCGRILAAFLSWVCSMSRSLAGFKRLARTLTLRMVLLLWAAVCYNMVGRVFHHALGANIAKDTATVYNWVNELKRAFKFLMIAFAIIFGQGIVLELASVQYVQGWMGPRSQRAFDELETIKKLQHLVDPHVSAETLGIVRKVCRVLFLPIDSNDLYYQISNGGGDNEMWSAYANKIWNSIARGKQALTRFHIDQQLRDMHRDTSHAQDLFTQLDESCDGNVTQDELEKLVQRIGLQLNVRAQAQRGINSLLRKLEAILCIVMVGIILFLYIQFFAKGAAHDLGTFWTGLTGLSFAFSGVLLEFTNSCVFVFGKHPYDVGDYIETKGKKLIVNKIFLTHTNFEEVGDPDERGIVAQISHAALTAEVIVNWTRTMEAVIEKRRNEMREEERRAMEEAEREARAKEEDRDLILLKTARLRSAEDRS